MLENKTVGIENPPPLDVRPFDVDEQAEQDDASLASGGSGDKSIRMQMNDLVDDVRKLAEAEIEYYRIKLSVNLAATKTVLLLFSAAAVIAVIAAVALILGILLILSHYWGPVAATLLLTGSALLVTTLLLNMAIQRARKLPLDENDQ